MRHLDFKKPRYMNLHVCYTDVSRYSQIGIRGFYYSVNSDGKLINLSIKQWFWYSRVLMDIIARETCIAWSKDKLQAGRIYSRKRSWQRALKAILNIPCMHTFFTVCCEFVLANDDQFFDNGKLDVATQLSIALRFKTQMWRGCCHGGHCKLEF